MKSLLLSTLLLFGCAGGQVLKGPDRQDPHIAVEKDTTKDSNHIYAFMIWISVLGAGIYLFVRNEKSSTK